jgi:hypothetical protein
MSEIVKILFPDNAQTTEEMLETASEIGVQEMNRLVGTNGLFYSPGVLASEVSEDKLLPTLVDNGDGTWDLSISVGKAATVSGAIISLTSVATRTYPVATLTSYIGKYLFINYQSETDSTITSIVASTGGTVNVSVVKNVASATDAEFDSLFTWKSSNTLTDLGIPLGKLDGDFTFNVSDYRYRRIALLNVLFVDENTVAPMEIVPDVTNMCSIYSFLASRGRTSRATDNPFGLTDVDVEHVNELVRALVETPGIPARSLSSGTNSEYLQVSEGATSGTVDVVAGYFVDSLGRYVGLPTGTTAFAVTNDTTWYYLYIQYADEADGASGTAHVKKGATLALQTAVPVAPKFALARVRNTAGTVEVVDARARISCRMIETTPPSTPTGLMLTWGSERDWYESDLGYGAGTYMNDDASVCYIHAEWAGSTGDVAYYEIYCLPIADDDTVRYVDAIRGKVDVELTTSLEYTFHNVLPGVRYRVALYAVGLPPGFTKTSPIEEDVTPGESLAVTGLECLDSSFVYSSNANQWMIGTSISWDPTTDAIGYEYQVWYGASQVGGGVGNGTSVWEVLANAETYTIKVRAKDSVGHYGNWTTLTWYAGDELPPVVSTDDFDMRTNLPSAVEPCHIVQTVYIGPSNVHDPDVPTGSTTKPGVGINVVQLQLTPVNADTGLPDEDPFVIRVKDIVNSPSGVISYTWTGLTPGVKYYGRILATDKLSNQSAPTEWVEKVAGNNPAAPSVPGSVYAQDIYNGIKVTWSYNESEEDYLDRFDVYVSYDGSDPYDSSHYSGSTPPHARSYNVLLGDAATGTVNARYLVTAVGINKIESSSSAQPHSPINFVPPSELQALKAEVIAARGTQVSLDARISTTASDYSQEIISATRGFTNLRQSIEAAAAGVTWEGVRIIAKSGGQFTTLQAAIDSVSLEGSAVIYVMPGEYNEGDIYTGYKAISIVGIGGQVILTDTRFTPDVDGVCGVMMVKNIMFMDSSGENRPLIYPGGMFASRSIYIDDVDILTNTSGPVIKVNNRKYIALNNVRINAATASAGFLAETTVPDYLILRNSSIYATCGVDYQAGNSGVRITAEGCMFKGTASITGNVGDAIPSYAMHNTWQAVPTGLTLNVGSVDTNTILTLPEYSMFTYEYAP